MQPSDSLLHLRRLARFSKWMDGLIRLPFLRRGLGIDALLASLPIAGDIAGFALTLYAFYLARKAGASHRELIPAYRLAVLDLFAGSIPLVGILFDISIRPSTKALQITEAHFAQDALPPKRPHSRVAKIGGLLVFCVLLYVAWKASLWLFQLF